MSPIPAAPKQTGLTAIPVRPSGILSVSALVIGLSSQSRCRGEIGRPATGREQAAPRAGSAKVREGPKGENFGVALELPGKRAEPLRLIAIGMGEDHRPRPGLLAESQPSRCADRDEMV